MSKKQIEAKKYAKKLKKLGKKTNLENDKCADCGTARPSWVSITIGVFLCMRCSFIHRNLGQEISQIKSIDLDSWNHHSYKLFKQKGGNKKINRYYECHKMGWNKSLKPNWKTDQFQIMQYIQLKYVEKKWYTAFPPKQPKREKKSKKTNQKKQVSIYQFISIYIMYTKKNNTTKIAIRS